MLLVLALASPVQKSPPVERVVLLILDPGHGGKDRGGNSNSGFKLAKARIPEDPYTYDMAKRIAALANQRGWLTAFTVKTPEDDAIKDSDENNILPAREKMIFNLPNKKITVFRGKIGLRHRLEAVKNIVNSHRGATAIFVSLHFESAPSNRAGARIFTVWKLIKHPLIKALEKQIKDNEFQWTEDGKPEAIIRSCGYVVIKEGTISPRVLIELGNFNNEQDRLLMLRSDGRQKYAEMIAAAIDDYLLGLSQSPAIPKPSKSAPAKPSKKSKTGTS